MKLIGSLSATTTANSAGAKTPIFGLFTGIIVLLACQYITPAFYYVPRPALAAVIITGVLMKINFSILIPMWKSKSMNNI